MTELTHGGDWAGFQQEFGTRALDYSSNISPLGLPESVRAAVIASLERADRYPDPLCRELRRALSRHHGVPEDRIVCGNGAADIIARTALGLRPKRALLTAPTFSEYEQSLRQAGCDCEHFTLVRETNFAVTEEILERIGPGTELVMLCEPNNPTGVTTERALLLRILARCRDVGAYLVIDECFNEFLDEPERHTLLGELAENDNLILIKAFTKCYAMAGLRLGYALCGSKELADRVYGAGQPWAVSTPAQEAGIAALGETAYITDMRRVISAQRRSMTEALKELGCDVIPGEANYLLFACPERKLCIRLRQKGVLLRDCSNYPGLGAGWYRCAVRGQEENTAFLRALKEVLTNG